MQELSANTEYWKAGAAKIKSVAEQALGLSPMSSQGKEYLNEFNKQATEQVQKLAKTDLRVQDNANQIMGVYKPLYDTSNPFNKQLLMDDNVNKFYAKQMELSDNYRTKDGGKQWNQNNHIYMMDAYSKYASSIKDSYFDENGNGKMEELSNKRKEFIPYYDYSKELHTIINDCPESSSEVQSPSGDGSLYMKSNKVSGVDPHKIMGCLSTSLSSNAKQQLAIDGYASYRGREQDLLNDYKASVIEPLSLHISSQQAKLANMKLQGKQNTDLYKSIESDIKESTNNLFDRNKEFDGMHNIDEIKNNFDAYAGRVYLSKFVSDMGQSFSYQNSSEKYSTDGAAVVKYNAEKQLSLQLQNQEFLKGMQEDRQIADKEMAQLNHDNKVNELIAEGKIDPTTGKPIPKSPLGNRVELNQTLSSKITNTISKISKEASDLSTSISGMNNELYQYIIDSSDNMYNHHKGDPFNKSERGYVNAFLSSYKSGTDANIDKFLSDINSKTILLTTKNNIISLAKNASVDDKSIPLEDLNNKGYYPTISNISSGAEKKINDLLKPYISLEEWKDLDLEAKSGNQTIKEKILNRLNLPKDFNIGRAMGNSYGDIIFKVKDKSGNDVNKEYSPDISSHKLQYADNNSENFVRIDKFNNPESSYSTPSDNDLRENLMSNFQVSAISGSVLGHETILPVKNSTNIIITPVHSQSIYGDTPVFNISRSNSNGKKSIVQTGATIDDVISYINGH